MSQLRFSMPRLVAAILSIMVRFLLIVAMTCAVGAAGLGFFNREKMTKLAADVVAEKDRSSKMQALADDLQQRLLQAEEDLQQKVQQAEERIADQERLAQQERDSWTAEVSTAKTKVDQLTEQLNQRENEIKGLTTALADANRNLDLKKRAEDDRQLLANRLINVESELNQLRLAAAEKDKNKTPPVLHGTILSMNREAQALTVSLGSDLGVTTKSHLKVEKNGETISELRVVSVDKNSCTAEFLSNGPENFARVSVGDLVVFTKR
jgi:polyhydroxyalkanoate synthesis regulator phasin